MTGGNPGAEAGEPREKPNRAGGALPRRRRWWPLLLPAAAYTAYFWSNPIGAGAWSPFGPGMLSGDSASYLDPGPEAGAGYPLFLDFLEAALGGLEAIPRAQLLLMAAAVVFLGASVSRALDAPRLGFGVALAAFAASAVARFHAYLLSEALFVPLLCALLGALLLVLRRPSWPGVALAASLCGLAVATRPPGALLLAVWPFLGFLLWRRAAGQRGRLAAAAALPLAFCFLPEAADWSRVEGDLAGPHLFAKALLIPPEPPATGDPAADGLLAEARDRVAPLREVVSGAPGGALGSLLLRRSERTAQHLRYYGLEDRAERVAAARGLNADALLAALGRTALLAAPGEWAANASRHYAALWMHPTVHTEALAREFRARTAALRDPAAFPGSRVAAPLSPAQAFPGWFVGLVRAAGGAAFLLSTLALFLALGLRLRTGVVPLPLAGAAVAALSVHAYFLTAAVLNFATMRYASAMWIPEAVCGLLFLGWASPRIGAALSRRGRDSTGSPAGPGGCRSGPPGR